jgi:hypothetical protein
LLWFTEMMCSGRRGIGEIGRSVAHHLPMMCTTDGGNGFRARVCCMFDITPLAYMLAMGFVADARKSSLCVEVRPLDAD